MEIEEEIKNVSNIVRELAHKNIDLEFREESEGGKIIVREWNNEGEVQQYEYDLRLPRPFTVVALTVLSLY